MGLRGRAGREKVLHKQRVRKKIKPTFPAPFLYSLKRIKTHLFWLCTDLQRPLSQFLEMTLTPKSTLHVKEMSLSPGFYLCHCRKMHFCAPVFHGYKTTSSTSQSRFILSWYHISTVCHQSAVPGHCKGYGLIFKTMRSIRQTPLWPLHVILLVFTF